MSKRIRIFTAEDVLQHNLASSCWITYRGKVLDVTDFLTDHPGGEDIILKHAGRDVEGAMNDVTEHVHSESAYDMLDEFLIGRLGAGENIVNDDWVATDDFTPEDTDRAADYEKNEFLDLRKPLMRQMWNWQLQACLLREKLGANIDFRFAAKDIIFNKFTNLGTFPSLLASLSHGYLR
jgi:4-hydroxysphinganine ceramide fatty acyl 2-hydroxylase